MAEAPEIADDFVRGEKFRLTLMARRSAFPQRPLNLWMIWPINLVLPSLAFSRSLPNAHPASLAGPVTLYRA